MSLYCLHLKGYPIEEQLKLEEFLLKNDKRNWCIFNEGSSPAIVMGISGKPHLLIDQEKLTEKPLPLIRRFSGGGTVVIDEETLFVTFIFQKKDHPFPPFPEPIMRWTEEIYKNVFPEGFALRENDYVMGEHKCGGNAQYIKKTRWLHHTSFLWNYKPEYMDYLLHPPRTPQYRVGRKHTDFLCTLSSYFTEKQQFFTTVKSALSSRYSLEEVYLSRRT